MFRKLRVKFIAIIMVSIALVLGIVFTGICFAEYQRSSSSVDAALSAALERAGGQPQEWKKADKVEAPPFDADRSGEAPSDEFSPDGGKYATNAQEDAFDTPRIGGREQRMGDIVPVAVYRIETDSSLSLVRSSTSASISDEVLEKAQEVAGGLAAGNGTLGDVGLYYEKRAVHDSEYIAFADISATSSWETLALYLAVAAVGILAVFFVISLAFSQWALKPIREAWDSQRQFVADASHELKTPLTVILANSSILLKHPESSIASQSQWIESTQVEANSMQGLVNEMLELAQVEERAAVHHEPLDFSDLASGVTLQFESVAFENAVELEDDIASGVNVDGDAQRLTKMTSTLLENALKYAGTDGHVSVRLTRQGSKALLAINNTGPAIDPEDIKHIFDRFYRTDKARTSGTGGFGLGLAIAREIAREHGGDIACTSDAASGTTFTVTLPTC